MFFQKKNGYIYILSNPAFADNLLKIGMTTRTPEKRAREIYETHTGVPFKFKVEYKKLVGHCEFAEEIIHKRLYRFRANNNREFFKISLNEAKKIIDEVCKEIEKIYKKTILSNDRGDSDTTPEEKQTVSLSKGPGGRYIPPLNVGDLQRKDRNGFTGEPCPNCRETWYVIRSGNKVCNRCHSVLP